MLNPPVDRLRPLLTELLSLECAITERVGRLCEPAAQRAQATAALAELESLAARHADALRARMCGAPMALAGGEGRGDWDPVPSAPSAGLAEAHPVSAAVRDAYVLVQRAAIAYAALVPISNRLRDSWVMADEGTTSHIGRQHMQDYIAIAGRLLTLMHNLLIDELEADGVVCGCTCPCCSIGVCVCGPGSYGVFREAVMAAHPSPVSKGFAVHPPRPGSAAAAAGLLHGDVITAFDAEPVEQLTQLTRLVRDHEPGEVMQFTVRRSHGEISVQVDHRRQGADLNEDECMLPAGQGFYFDQAREVQRRLRRQFKGRGTDAEGLGRLSPRELQVLRLIALGATNPMIADELEIRRRPTVAYHVKSILAKLGATNRTEAARVATEQGLLNEA